MSDFWVVQVTRKNYHLFDDMVFWRQQGRERTAAEKQSSRDGQYLDAWGALDSGHLFVYAVQSSGRFVGWISIVFMPKVGPWSKGVLYVDELWTAPDYRRQGVASLLLAKVRPLQAQLQAAGVRLYVGADNPGARKLYESFGFRARNAAIFMEYEDADQDG